MIYSRTHCIDRAEIKLFDQNIEEDATLMLIALRDIRNSMKGHLDESYEIKWRVNPREHKVTDSHGDRVEWCKLRYTDDRWIYCHNNVCMQFTRDELKTSVLYVMDGNVFVYLDGLLETIISVLVDVGIPEQYLFSRKQREFLINCGVRRAMEEKLIDIGARIRRLYERIERDSQYERDDETNQNLCLTRRNIESMLFEKDNAERLLAAINI